MRKKVSYFAKIISLFCFLFSVSICSVQAGWYSSGIFEFQVNEEWEIKKWGSNSGTLKITQKISPDNYLGLLSITAIGLDPVAGMKIKNIFQTVTLKVEDNKEVKITGVSIKGSKQSSLTKFFLTISNDELLQGRVENLKENVDKTIFLTKQTPKSLKARKTISSNQLISSWFLSKEFLKKIKSEQILVKSLIFSFQDKNILRVEGILKADSFLVTLKFDGKWGMKSSYLVMSLSNMQVKTSVEGMDSELYRALAEQLGSVLIKEQINPMFKQVVGKQMIVKISEISDSKISGVMKNIDFDLYKKK
ncbi:MAG: hypothetical protein ACI86H_001240 [bacterium]|jgi:hypothetical protein